MDINSEYQWQLLHGKDGSHSTTWALKACYEILQESFDPIIDQVSGQDLVKGMVFSVQQGEWDHTGMFAAILRYKASASAADAPGLPPPPDVRVWGSPETRMGRTAPRQCLSGYAGVGIEADVERLRRRSNRSAPWWCVLSATCWPRCL